MNPQYDRRPQEPRYHRVSMLGEFVIVVAWVAFIVMVYMAKPWVPTIIAPGG